MNLTGQQVQVTNYGSPWFSYTGTVVEECKDGTLLVQFSAGRQRFIPRVDVAAVGKPGVYWSAVKAA